ncbi:hypothetical protein AOLI_G00018020 [Acnodon oligacanthus]
MLQLLFVSIFPVHIYVQSHCTPSSCYRFGTLVNTLFGFCWKGPVCHSGREHDRKERSDRKDLSHTPVKMFASTPLEQREDIEKPLLH